MKPSRGKKYASGRKPPGGKPGNKNALGHDGSNAGRPNLFKPEFVDRIIAFFDIEPYRDEVYESAKEYFANGDLKKVSQKLKQIPNKLPTLFRFARSIGVAYVTVNSWYRKGRGTAIDPDTGDILPKDPMYEDFCDAFDSAKEMQKEFLIALGLSGASPSAAYIFTAKNLTDMRDKFEGDLTSQGKSLGVIMLPPKVPLPDEQT